MLRVKPMWIMVPIALISVLVSLAIFNYLREWLAPPFDPSVHTLHYEREGRGQPTLLLHGLAGSSSFWNGRLGHFADKHDVLMPDLLGFGRSPKPDADYSLDDHLKAIMPLVKSTWQGQRQKIVLIAHSMGAVIALEAKRRYPEVFGRTILVSTPIFTDQAQAAERLGKASIMYKATLTGNVLVHLSCYIRDFYRMPFLARFFDVPRDVYVDALSHTWVSLSRSLSNTVVGGDNDSRISGLDGSDIFFVHTEDDDVAPFDQAKELAHLAGANFFSLPSGGHNFFLKDPQAFWELVRNFR